MNKRSSFMLRAPRHRRVAIALPTGVPFLERLLHGVMDHARQANWSLMRMPESYEPPLNWLGRWRGDGALVLVTTPAEAKVAQRLPLPVVNLASYLIDPGVPTVSVDHEAVGRLAARHLIERGFRRFAYYGGGGPTFSTLRRQGFSEEITKIGGTLSVFEVPLAQTASRRYEQMVERWISTLTYPVGVMASNDLRANFLLDLAERLGVAVPNAMAILGVDDDPVTCLFARPPLSSVARNDQAVGLAAAQLLGRLMAGGKPPTGPIRLPPAGIVTRASTATWEVEHPQLAAAVTAIQTHLHEPFGVERLETLLPWSRRRIESLFMECLGCSPYRFILQARIERARSLLAASRTDSLTQIAKQCGFVDLRHFRRAFVRITGKAPSRSRHEISAVH